MTMKQAVNMPRCFISQPQQSPTFQVHLGNTSLDSFLSTTLGGRVTIVWACNADLTPRPQEHP